MDTKIVKLSDVVSHKKEFIIIDDNIEYKRCRVKLHRQGIVIRDIIKGSEINTKKQQVCKTGQLLVAEIDAKVGGYGIVPEELNGAIVSSHYFLFDVDLEKINLAYLEYYLKTDVFFNQIKPQGSTNYAAIRPRDVLNINIPMPLKEIQRDIIQKLNVAFDNIDSFSSKNELNNENLIALRQSILQEAVQGRLVQQDPSDEPVSVLLERIKAEKKELVQKKKIKNEKNHEPITDDIIPYVLPHGWEWARLGDIVALENGSIRRGPFGSAIRKDMFVPKAENTYKVYEQGNAIRKSSSYGDYYISESKFNELQSFEVKAGDIIISCAGTIGETYLIPDDAPKGVINQALLKLRMNNKVIRNDYFLYLFKSLTQLELNEAAKGSAMKNLVSIDTLKNNVIFPIPPLKEQKRIVEKVNQIIEMCEELQNLVDKSKLDSQMLMQAILQEAFESHDESKFIILT